MKNKVISLFIFILLVITLAGCSDKNDGKSVGIKGIRFYDSNVPQRTAQLTPEGFLDEFDAIVATIDKWYALKERKNITSDLLNELYRNRVIQARDTKQMLEILTEMFATLNNGHARPFEYRMNGLAEATVIENHYVLTRLSEQSDLARQGIQTGWHIKSIDNKPIAEWIEFQKKYFGGTDQWVKRNTTYHVFMRFPFQAAERTYTFSDNQGTKHIATITLQNSFSDFMNAFDPQEKVFSEIIEADRYRLAYLSLHEMSDEAISEFDSHLTQLLEADGLILDLRTNSGGSSAAGDAIFRRLIQEPTPGWMTVTDHMPLHTPHENPNYNGPMVMLIGNKTFSAAESFAFDLYDADRAIFVGEVTGGCSGGGPRSFITAGGFGFAFPTRGVDLSVSGLEMEGTGIIPHVEVYQTLVDYYHGYDTVLNEGIKQLIERLSTTELN